MFIDLNSLLPQIILSCHRFLNLLFFNLFQNHFANNLCLSNIVELSRSLEVELCTQAWVKFYEILSTFLGKSLVPDCHFMSVHLCEAPGAFVTALNHFLQQKGELYTHHNLHHHHHYHHCSQCLPLQLQPSDNKATLSSSSVTSVPTMITTMTNTKAAAFVVLFILLSVMVFKRF